MKGPHAAGEACLERQAGPPLGITKKGGDAVQIVPEGTPFPTPEGRILFDINDFDETLPGVDFTVDLKRLAASVAVAAKAAHMSGKQARSFAASTVTDYREHMFALRELSPSEIWHSKIDLQHELTQIESPGLRRSLSTLIRNAQARGLDRDDNFPHLVTAGEPRIADKPPKIFHISPKTLGGRKIDFDRGFALYRETLTPDRTVLLDRYRLTDVAFKAVGVGSVGTICVVGLFLSGDGEPLFLQVKQAQRSVLERLSEKLVYQGPQGRRVVEGQRMMQAATDILLGWTSDEPLGVEFYVRILKNRRLGAVSELAEQAALSEYARLCGRTLARSHSRTGEDPDHPLIQVRPRRLAVMVSSPRISASSGMTRRMMCNERRLPRHQVGVRAVMTVAATR